MPDFWVGIGAVLLLVFFIGLGVHIGIALGIIGLAGMIILIGFENAILQATSVFFFWPTAYILMALPLFIMVGLLASEAEITQECFKSLNSWVGGIKGGALVATISAAALFGAISGSSIVDATVIARTCGPELRRLGYEKTLIYGTIAAASITDSLIPPSIFAVVFASLTEQSIGKLFMAGLSVGILLTIALCATAVVQCHLSRSFAGRAVPDKVGWRQRIVDVKGLWPIGIIALVVIGGIYSGIFTPTEAAAIAAAAVLLVGLASRLSWKRLGRAASESVSMTGMVFLLLIGAQIFSRFEVLSGVTPRLVDFIVGLGVSRWQVVGLILFVMLLMGCFIDALTITVVVVPTVYPLLRALNIDLIWFGTLTILMVNIGGLTPPVGLLAFAVKAVAGPDVTVEDVFRGAFIPLLSSLVVTVFVLAFPTVATWLPNMMRGR